MVNIRLAAVCLAAASALLIEPSSSMPTSSSSSKRGITNRRSPSTPATHHTINRRRTQIGPFNSEEELLQWTENHRAGLRAKYSSKLQDSNEQERKRRKRSTTGSTQLTNYQHDSTFFAPVSIGTPGQTVGLVLDTGSSDVWTVQGKEGWNPEKSSTFINSTTPFKIAYGSGSVSGTEATDIVTLAGNSVRQEFAIATSISSGLLGNAVEGIMGLGFPSLSTSKATPFWQNVGASEFSFYLAAESANATSSQSGEGSGSGSESTINPTSIQYDTDQVYGGVFTLGGRNSSLYQGDINWSNVIDESYWLITLGGITVNGASVGLSGTNKVAVDTGTTLIGTPQAVVESIYAQVPNSNQMSSGYYTFPCSETNFTAAIHFGNQEYILTSDNLIAGTTDSTGTTCLGAFFSIGSSSNDELQYIFGDTFLMNVYSIFSNQNTNAQVGFASLANGLGATTSSRTVSSVVAANGAIQTLSNFPAVFYATLLASLCIFFA